jgi:hypothetical protein
LCRRPVALAAAINSGLNVDRSGWVAVRRRAGAAGVPRVDEPSEGAAAAAAARTRSEFDLEEWQQPASPVQASLTVQLERRQQATDRTQQRVSAKKPTSSGPHKMGSVR